MANIFEFLSKDGNITPEKARKSRQMQFHDKTAYVWMGILPLKKRVNRDKCSFATKQRICLGSSLSMRSLAIEEPGSPVPALYATLCESNSVICSAGFYENQFAVETGGWNSFFKYLEHKKKLLEVLVIIWCGGRVNKVAFSNS